MKLSQLAKIYGLPETATEAEVMRAAEGAAASRDVVLTLSRKMDTYIERENTKELDALIEKGAAEGKLRLRRADGKESEQVQYIRKLAKIDLGLAREAIQTAPSFVDTNEYGYSGNQGEAPHNPADLKPGVRRELVRLGRNPDTLNLEPLESRWDKLIAERQLKRSQELGIPPRASVMAVSAR